MNKYKRISAVACLISLAFLLMPPATPAWNATGHMMVARIAWDTMSPGARQRAVALLMAVPNDACLRELFPTDSRPLIERQREFFMIAATWPDIVRPKNENDHRICTKYHRGNWHFVDHFWKGISGDVNDPPRDLPLPISQINASERIKVLRNLTASQLPPSERAMMLAWILHLVGDIHQPLHTSGRVTSVSGEQQGDRGGNTFKLGPGNNALNLHSYWDNIVDRVDPRHSNETFPSYLDRLTIKFEGDHPLSSVLPSLQPGQIDNWVIESLNKAKANAYPRNLSRGHLPSANYRNNTFTKSEECIARGGYRLGNLLTQLFGP